MSYLAGLGAVYGSVPGKNWDRVGELYDSKSGQDRIRKAKKRVGKCVPYDGGPRRDLRLDSLVSCCIAGGINPDAMQSMTYCVKTLSVMRVDRQADRVSYILGSISGAKADKKRKSSIEKRKRTARVRETKQKREISTLRKKAAEVAATSPPPGMMPPGMMMSAPGILGAGISTPMILLGIGGLAALFIIIRLGKNP